MISLKMVDSKEIDKKNRLEFFKIYNKKLRNLSETGEISSFLIFDLSIDQSFFLKKNECNCFAHVRIAR